MPSTGGQLQGLAVEALAVAVLVCVLVPLLLPLLRRVAMDHPNMRSSHTQPVPRGGGLAVLVGTTFAAFLWPWPSVELVVGVIGVAALGLLDDVFTLPVAPRLLGIAAASVWISFTMRSSVSAEGVVEFVVCMAAAVLLAGFTNAFNFMDGINGISGMNALAIGGSLAIVAIPQSTSVAAMAVALAAAGAGFLPWNAWSAKVFLGDVGSYALGFGLASCGLAAWHVGVPILLVIAPFGIYVLDTGTSVIRRLARRKSVLKPHREHVYQRLVDGTAGHFPVALLVATFSLLLVGAAIVARQNASLGVVGGGLVAGLYLLLPKVVAPTFRRPA